MKAIILDLDDTLYRHEQFVRSGFAAVAAVLHGRFGIPADDARAALARAAALTPGAALQDTCREFGLNLEVVPDLLHAYRTHTPALSLSLDAAAALVRLRDDGWRLAVLTNGLPAVQASKIDALNLRGLVDHVVLANEHAAGGKPHPDAFREVLRRVNLPARRCVMVGDNPECDTRGGRDAGLWTIGIRRPDAAVEHAADIVVDVMAEVPAAAEALIQKVGTHAA